MEAMELGSCKRLKAKPSRCGMSKDINVHVWVEGDDYEVSRATVAKVLQCIEAPVNRTSDGRQLARFGRLTVYDGDSFTKCLSEELNTNDIEIVLETIGSLAGPQYHCEIESAFDCVRFDPLYRATRARVQPVTIHFFGSTYGWQGLEFKSYGPIRIDFSNTKAFEIPSELVEFVRSAAVGAGDTFAALNMIAELSRNFNSVSGLAERMIASLDPEHLLICTDLEVHPLTSHAIYHNNWRDFIHDLSRILRLHSTGGVYLRLLHADDPAFVGPRKNRQAYGYLRDEYGDGSCGALARRLDEFDSDLRSGTPRFHLSRENIEKCFEMLSATYVEPVGGSFFCQ